MTKKLNIEDHQYLLELNPDSQEFIDGMQKLDKEMDECFPPDAGQYTSEEQRAIGLFVVLFAKKILGESKDFKDVLEKEVSEAIDQISDQLVAMDE